ncbi:MAG TPA: hypothetical protein VD833_12875 [Vicinamibacterales bacterium]|nr:hypothetical protein [Vicinamibacterales bacterium]
MRSGRLYEGIRTLLGVAALLVAAVAAPGCLVLSLNPAYDDETIGFDPGLLGTWLDAEDKSSLEIERGDWKSYRIRYVHPVETGTLTAYLTVAGDHRVLDVMPLRGEDRGSFVIPVHAVVRVELAGDRLDLTPLSFDWFDERLRRELPIPGIEAVLDQKENAILLSPTAALRAWLRGLAPDAPVFGAAATFIRKRDGM